MADPRILKVVEEVYAALASEPRHIEDVARALGMLDGTQSTLIQAEFVPHERELFSHGKVIPEWGTREAVIVSLAVAGDVSVEDVKSLFGPLQESIRMHFDDPRTLVTDPEPADYPCGFRILAELKPGPEAIEYRGSVAFLKVMRQPKLSEIDGQTQ